MLYPCQSSDLSVYDLRVLSELRLPGEAGHPTAVDTSFGRMVEGTLLCTHLRAKYLCVRQPLKTLTCQLLFHAGHLVLTEVFPRYGFVGIPNAY